MINLYNILQNILQESVSSDKVIDAINNRYQVIINYSDEKARAPKKRLIEPYAYGVSEAGNSVFRTFQYDGDTFRGKPKWKLFRLDRVESWTPTEQHFNVDPKTRGWNAPAFNEQGDDSMVTVLSIVDLDNGSSNPFDKGSDLWLARQKTDNMRQSTPINVKQMQDVDGTSQSSISPQDVNGPQVQKAAPVYGNNMTPEDFRNMINRNLELTRQEKTKRGRNTLGQIEEPIIEPSQNEPKPSNDVSTQPNDLQDMIARNLELTRQEKAKRGRNTLGQRIDNESFRKQVEKNLQQ